MMDHVTFLKSLPPSDKAWLTRRSTAAGLWHLTGYLAAIGVFGTYIVAQLPGWPLAMLPLGILLCFLFTLSHECTHQTPFAAPWLSNWVGHAISPIIALPFTWFRYFHLAHHRHTNDPNNDPELEGEGRPGTRRAYAVYLSGWSYWSGGLRTVWRNAFGSITAPYLPERQHAAIRREARILLALYCAALVLLPVFPMLFWLWIVPVLLGQPFLRLYLLAEHGHCPPVANMLENTRTIFTNQLVRWLAWNMPYHAEHHSYPAVPFHRLPDLHARMRQHLQSTSQGYAAFTRVYLKQLGD